jgi:hypothetical protein
MRPRERAFQGRLDTEAAAGYQVRRFVSRPYPKFLRAILARDRTVKRLMILAAILLPSCAAPNLAGPTSSFVSHQVVQNADCTARAFRIDIEEKERPEPKARYTLSPLPLDERGLIPHQFPFPPTSATETAVLKRDSQFTYFGPAEVFCEFTVLVRVYRPGYRTIEIRAGDKTREWHWVPADFLEQEKAIDALLGVQPGPDGRWGGWWKHGVRAPHSELGGSTWPGGQTIGDYGLQPGSVSAKHREALLFAAGEYERLAKSCTTNSPTLEKARHRLERKAAQMNRYTDELTTEEFWRKQANPTTR